MKTTFWFFSAFCIYLFRTIQKTFVISAFGKYDDALNRANQSLKHNIPQTWVEIHLEFSSIRKLDDKTSNLQITSICISIPEIDPKLGMAG